MNPALPGAGLAMQPARLLHMLRRSALTLPLAALAALLLFGINEAAYDRSTAALAALGQRGAARNEVQQVWRALIDAETWQRGYLLTGRRANLQPYQQAVDAADSALAWLAAHYRHDAEAAPLLERLVKPSRARLSELAATLDLREQGRRAWRELVLTDIGREQMEDVRQATQQLLDLETRRVGAERNDVFATVQGGRLGVNLMTGLSLLALLLFLRQTLALNRAQQRHAAEVQAGRDRLDAEVTRRTTDLTELARHLQNAREEEKSRLARELHDELGALLTAVHLDTARLKRMLGAPTRDAAARLEHLQESINRGIAMKRRIIENLRPSALGSLGLVAALEILVREAAEATAARVNCELEAVALADSAQITVYRLVQEALANTARHAGAQQVDVRLQASTRAGRSGALVSVQDDGRGFDATAPRTAGHGLIGLRYRIEAEGGHFALDTAPGQGTRVAAWLPLAEASAEPGDLGQ